MKVFELFIGKHLFIVLAFICFQAKSQNLIPNGNFESTVAPLAYDKKVTSIKFSEYWGNYSNGFLCYHSIDSNKSCGYSRVAVYNPWSKDSRSYLQNKLIRPLEKGESCYFKIMVNPDGKYYCNRFSILLLKDSLDIIQNKLIELQPTLEFNSNYFIKNGGEWELLSGYFIAQGGEQFIIIGNFYPDRKTYLKRNRRKTYSVRTEVYIDNCELYGSFIKQESTFSH